MEAPQNNEDIKKIIRLQSKLTMMAWQELYNSAKRFQVSVNEDEMEFIEAAVLATQKQYDEIDSFSEQLLNDHAGIALMQSAMAPYMNKDEA